MMLKRKDRALQELYDLTGKIRGQEISPVLKGSSCVKRSLEETNHDLRTDSETFPSGKAIGNSYLNEKFHIRAQSGTCNVCATPCSSCMHYNRMVSVMESKVEDEFSDDASMVLPLKSRASDDRQHTASEASNFHSASSSHDSLSENAQSKVTTRTCDVSDAFEDVEMHTKLSSRTSRRHDEQQGIDCYSDDISCVTGAKEESRHDTASKDSPREKCSGTASETAHVCQKSNPSGFLSAKDVHALQLQQSHSRTGNSLFACGDSKDSGENSSSQLRAEAPECSLERGDSPLAGRATSNTFNEEKSAIQESPSDLQKGADCESSLIRHGSSPCMVTKIDMDGDNPPTKSIKCSDLNKKSGASFDVSDMQEPPAQSQPISESDHSESDTMLDDVKVCDLCGDAGREDLLAICSRCSDGAEHIYCMRVMLDKVPGGDWLCEVCQLKEDAEKIEAAKIKTMSTIQKACSNEKNKTPGGSFDAKHLPKLDVKAQETEEDQGVRIAASPRLPIKRSADKYEVPVVSKRQPIETSAGSPGMASPSRKSVLSLETSFKNFDVGKIKLGHTTPSFAGSSSQGGAHSINTSGPSTSRMQPVLQSSRGILSRSATFNNSNSKPKVKQLFGDVAQKKKLERQLSAGNVRREGSTRTISKSISFKSSGLGHSTFNETRAKMQSQNVSHAEDQRGSKQSEEHNPTERKNCSKLDSSVVSSLHVAGSRDVFRSEGMSSPGSANNSRNPKATHQDRKLNPSSDSAIFVTRKGSENSNASDVFVEVKKQPCLSALLAGPALNGKPNPGEQKPCQVDSREDTSASASSAAEGFCGSHNLTLQDGLFRFQESTNQDGKNSSSSNLPTRNISFGSKYVRCLKCNEVGHIPQFCTSASLHVSAVKASAARSPRVATNRSSKWRNAVEALVSSTRILGSSRLPDQLDDSSLTSTDLRYEVASKDQVSSSSSCLRNLSSQECLFHEQEALRSLTADSCWTASTVVATQHAACPMEPACASKEVNPNITPISDGTKPKPYMNHLPSPASVVGTPLGIPIIPEHDYIWQGGFEVKRSGRPAAFCDGIQAHLSTCASTKVANVVEKFPYKIWLEEVPRLSSWPVEFRRKCATEDNIALYFFAKDLDSYEKNYKKLLENMIKNDLALKGCFDRIELLIFPSNQLPEKCQRWNRLFFLWAVFIVRENCSIVDDGLSSEKNTSCLHPEIHPLASANQLNSSLQTCASSRITIENQRLCTEKEVHGNNESREVTELQPPVEATVVQMDPSKGKVVLTFSDSTNCRQMGVNSTSPEQGGTSSASSKIPVPTSSILEAAAFASRNKEEQALDKERLVENATSLKVDVWREPKRQEASSEEIRSNSSETISEASAETPVKSGKAMAQKESMGCILIDEERERKKMRISHKQILGDRFSPDIVDLDSCLPDTEQKGDCSDDNNIVSKSARTTERYLFPVDSGPVKDLVSGDSIPCQILSSDDEGLPESDAPNLELALGAVKKSPSKQGILPLFVPLADDKSNCSKLADPVTDNAEDVMSASLSLSLAFPFSRKEETVKLVSKKEEALPKKQNHVNTSLLLFGSSITDA